MKVKIYVNWEEREIVKEEELEEIKKDRVSNILDDPYDRRGFACDFLCDKDVSAADLFVMDEKERKELLTEFEKYVEEGVLEEIKDEYEEVTIEV